MVQNYPLHWPEGWKRCPPSERKNAQFNKTQRSYETYNGQSYTRKILKDLTVSDGCDRILAELNRMRVDRQDVIISTNVRTRLDGLPRSGEREPTDPGAAVYWSVGQGLPMRCMAIDRYTAVADNLAAIAATLEAMRSIERHGGAEILDRAFTGFKALASASAEPWWQVLELDSSATPDIINAQYRLLASKAHPDIPGGSVAAMQRLNIARDQALREKA